MYHTISDTEITVLYNDERDLHQSKMGKITTCRKQIHGTSVNTVASLLIEFKKYI